MKNIYLEIKKITYNFEINDFSIEATKSRYKQDDIDKFTKSILNFKFSFLSKFTQ